MPKMNPQDYVTPQGRYAQAAQEMSGARGTPSGMAPYPLYGTDLGQVEPEVAFYKRPVFCITVGVGVGVGLSYLWWEVLKPKFSGKSKKNTAKKAEAESA